MLYTFCFLKSSKASNGTGFDGLSVTGSGVKSSRVRDRHDRRGTKTNLHAYIIIVRCRVLAYVLRYSLPDGIGLPIGVFINPFVGCFSIEVCE